jgi:hypothetical protein
MFPILREEHELSGEKIWTKDRKERNNYLLNTTLTVFWDEMHTFHYSTMKMEASETCKT